MTDRNEVANHEKLIAEIATDAANSVGGYARPGYATYDAAERAARAAFEKALGEATVTPTDAVVLAAMNAYDERFATDNIEDYSPEHVEDMRRAVDAALRAAGGAR